MTEYRTFCEFAKIGILKFEFVSDFVFNEIIILTHAAGPKTMLVLYTQSITLNLSNQPTVITELFVFEYVGSLQGNVLSHDQVLAMMQNDLKAGLGQK